MIEVAGRKGLDVGRDLVALDQARIDRRRLGFGGSLRRDSGARRGDSSTSRWSPTSAGRWSFGSTRRRRLCRTSGTAARGRQRRVGDDPDFGEVDGFVLRECAVRRHQSSEGSTQQAPRDRTGPGRACATGRATIPKHERTPPLTPGLLIFGSPASLALLPNLMRTSGNVALERHFQCSASQPFGETGHRGCGPGATHGCAVSMPQF